MQRGALIRHPSYWRLDLALQPPKQREAHSVASEGPSLQDFVTAAEGLTQALNNHDKD